MNWNKKCTRCHKYHFSYLRLFFNVSSSVLVCKNCGTEYKFPSILSELFFYFSLLAFFPISFGGFKYFGEYSSGITLLLVIAIFGLIRTLELLFFDLQKKAE